MSGRLRILLSSQAGDPEDRRTWSGTPYLLLQALRSGGQLEVMAHSSVMGSSGLRLSRALDRLIGLRHAFIPGPVQRVLAGASVAVAARHHDCASVLHLGTYDIPLVMGRPAYIYVDNSYDFWERHALAARILPARQRRAFRELERRALGRVKHVFTAGQHVAGNLVSAFGFSRDRVTAVGTGLGSSIRPYHGPKDYAQGRLLIVAKLRPQDKGLGLLLEAFAQAREKMPHLSLTVIGGASYPELTGRPGVRGTGWITAEELQELFDQSTLYVMPATYEPWGLSYLEALACRTPVLGLRRGALPEISGDGRYGFLLGEPSVPALATLLLDALSDPQRLARMGSEGQQHCLAHYRWDRIAARIADVIAGHQTP